MKVYEPKVVTETKQVFKYVQCDICGSQATDNDNWEGEYYGVSETEIKYREGTSYPEGGSGTAIKVDICPTCFMEKLVPWLESQGVLIKKEEWDW
jgi:hypothetical protein